MHLLLLLLLVIDPSDINIGDNDCDTASQAAIFTFIFISHELLTNVPSNHYIQVVH